MRYVLVGIVTVSPLYTTLAVCQKDRSSQSSTFFETNIRPVLANRCFKCHGVKKQRGGLRLDSGAAVRAGGDSGPAVVPGNPGKSLLIRAIRHREKLQMPPKSKLPPREIADLITWVKMGAPWPGTTANVNPKKTKNVVGFTKEQKSFWSFQRPKQPRIPSVKNRDWVKTPIDAFILAKLEAKGLSASQPASRRLLIRRATFDLIGLPPTPAEVDAFMRDQSPNAFAKVVDRLLNSPHYGERWARHWLDVVRYADSNGMDENLAFIQAYHYRDYVVRAFNRDMPYDKFVRQQIAGDLLPKAGGDGVIATGFLCIGPKMLAEDDPMKMEMDIIDEQIDTIGRTFLGLTLGCARCHDHKFDPITAADYYALAGIFKSTHTMDNFRVVAKWHERQALPRSDVENINNWTAAKTRIQNAIDQMSQSERKRLSQIARERAAVYVTIAKTAQRYHKAVASLKPLSIVKRQAILVEAEDYQRGNVKKDSSGYGKGIGVILNKGQLPNVAEYDVTAKKVGPHQLDIRYAAAGARPVILSINGTVVKRNAAGGVTGSWFPDTQKWAAEGVYFLKQGRNIIRLECAGPFPHIDKLAIGRPTLPTGWQSLAELAKANNLQESILRRCRDYQKLSSKLSAIVNDPKGPFAPKEISATDFSSVAKKSLRRLRSKLAQLEATKPKVAMVMAVRERTATDLRLHIRGSHLTLGKTIARRFPTIFASDMRIPKAKSGRVELAQWITQPDHPLTSRVMVNRLWQWHFGKGLVRSPSNFGLLGERPDNQPLLDWLAIAFVENGWSIKKMHRMIMLSNAYQMSSVNDVRCAQIDPENKLLWRQNRRRLEAEALRDGLLAISGQLNRKIGGTLLFAKPRAYVTGTANSNYTKYDIPRRSIYLPVIRSALYDVFQAFDFPDPSFPSEVRASTTVPSQALFLMNSKFVHRQTSVLAERLISKHDNDPARLNQLYQKLFGRNATSMETRRAIHFLSRINAALRSSEKNDVARQVRAWQSLCRVMIATNEFVYVE